MLLWLPKELCRNKIQASWSLLLCLFLIPGPTNFFILSPNSSTYRTSVLVLCLTLTFHSIFDHWLLYLLCSTLYICMLLFFALDICFGCSRLRSSLTPASGSAWHWDSPPPLFCWVCSQGWCITHLNNILFFFFMSLSSLLEDFICILLQIIFNGITPLFVEYPLII